MASPVAQRCSLNEEDQKTVRWTVFPTNAIQFCLSIKVLFKLPLRQTTGRVASLLKLAGLDWAVPDYTTLCRRLIRCWACRFVRRHGKLPPSRHEELTPLVERRFQDDRVEEWSFTDGGVGEDRDADAGRSVGDACVEGVRLGEQADRCRA